MTGSTQSRMVAIAGLILVCLGVGIAYLQGTGFSALTRILALGGTGLLVIAAALGIGEILAALRTRQGRYGTNVVTGTLIVFAILVVVNVLGTRTFWRTDMTSANRFSLAPQSERVLAGLDTDIVIHTFVPRDNPSAYLRIDDLVREYDFATPRVSIRRVDPARDPAALERMGIRDRMWMAVQDGDRIERLKIEDMNEQAITNAILRVTRPDKKKLYFVSGHGERSITDAERGGFATVAGLLQNEGFDVLTLDLSIADAIPADCAALAIVQPRTPFVPSELALLGDYLARGRNALVAYDPVIADSQSVAVGLDSLLIAYGVRPGPGMIYDASPVARQRGLGNYLPIAASPEGRHEITAGFGQRYAAFPSVRPLYRIEGVGRAAVLAHSGRRSWEELDFLVTDEAPTLDGDRESPGPLAIGFAIELPARVHAPLDPMQNPDAPLSRPDTRLVVFGDSDFVSNANVGTTALSNQDLFLNSMAWLAEERDLIAVRPQPPDERRLSLGAVGRNTIRMASLVGFPLGVILLGIGAWSRRRRRDR